MPFDTFVALCLIAVAVAVVALEKTRWINGLAIVQLIAALLQVLLVADLLRLPWPGSELYLEGAIALAWIAVVVRAGAKWTIVTATLGAWLALQSLLLDLRWLRVDAIRSLLKM